MDEHNNHNTLLVEVIHDNRKFANDTFTTASGIIEDAKRTGEISEAYSRNLYSLIKVSDIDLI